jgi:hypothetical protein
VERPFERDDDRAASAGPCLRTSFSAASFASAPELHRNTRASSTGVRAASRSASNDCGSVVTRFVVSPIVDAASVTAATQRGCA